MLNLARHPVLQEAAPAPNLPSKYRDQEIFTEPNRASCVHTSARCSGSLSAACLHGAQPRAAVLVVACQGLRHAALLHSLGKGHVAGLVVPLAGNKPAAQPPHPHAGAVHLCMPCQPARSAWRPQQAPNNCPSLSIRFITLCSTPSMPSAHLHMLACTVPVTTEKIHLWISTLSRQKTTTWLLSKR